MSRHANGNNNNGHAVASSQGGYPANAWAFAADFNAVAAASAHHTTIVAANAAAAGVGGGDARQLLPSSSHYGQQNAAAATGNRRYRNRVDPYEGAAARRGHMGVVSSSAREKRTNGQRVPGQGDSERKRVVVACGRCRKRKIRCSGDDGLGGACTACKNANEPMCIFMRVSAGSVIEMRKKEEAQRRIADIKQANTFNYDMDACRQYQSRGTASVAPFMNVTSGATSMAYSIPSSGAFANPGNMVYSWVPGTVGGYPSSSGGAADMGYGIAYGGMPYHGIPSPDASYMGENLMERPTTSSMAADAGAFALQSLSQGLPTTSSRDSSSMPTSTPRSMPGRAPSVLGSTRGIPPSSVFSGSRAAQQQQYPSPATTPITSGVSPVWTGYEQSPYAAAAASIPAGMAAQSLERLPDLYSTTPPPPPLPSAESAATASSSRHSSQSADEQQQQQQHFGGLEYAESRGQVKLEDTSVDLV